MVATQIAARGISDPRVLRVMGKVPRHRFVPLDDLAYAYSDDPIPIGHGQTISQPYIVALMTSLLELTSSSRVLEVGTGSGYQAAVLGELVREVHTIELIPELASKAESVLRLLAYDNVHVHLGDGSLGWLESAPYDGILLAAAAPSVPKGILEQLAKNGRLVVPVGDREYQRLEIWKRTSQGFTSEKGIPVAFVPLRGQFGWNKREMY